MKNIMSKKNFERGKQWAASQDDPRLQYLAGLKQGAPLRILNLCGDYDKCTYVGVKPASDLGPKRGSDPRVIVRHAGRVWGAKLSDVLKAEGDVDRGVLQSGESFEICQCLSDADLHCIHTCNHEWVVFSTALAEVWLMLQCVHCGAHASVNDPTKDEWGEAFYAPEHPYLWVDKSRVTIRGIARRHVYKAGDEPPSDPESQN